MKNFKFAYGAVAVSFVAGFALGGGFVLKEAGHYLKKRQNHVDLLILKLQAYETLIREIEGGMPAEEAVARFDETSKFISIMLEE